MPSDCQRQITFGILFIKISEKLSTLWYSVPENKTTATIIEEEDQR